MGRVDGASSSTVDGKPQVDNQDPQINQQSTQPPATEQVTLPQPQQGIMMQPQQTHIVIQPHIYVQPAPSPVIIGAPAFQPNNFPQQPNYHPQTPNYIPQQPPPGPPPLPEPEGWTTGLFDCIDDPENAIITLFCPCVTFGQVAAAIDSGATSCETSGMIYTCVLLIIAMPCIVSCTYRTKLRGRFKLMEEPPSDCLTHLCCEYCALCQEYRELNNRGINPSAGWMRNGSFNHQQQRMVPPPYQTMR